MTISVLPTFQSGLADDAAATAAGEVTPTRWNQGSVMTQTAAGIVGNPAPGTSRELTAAEALALAGAQAADADLTAIAALTSAADRLPYATGAQTWAVTTFTAAGRALVDDATAAAQRATLELDKMIQTHIEGLKVVWDSASSISIWIGSAYVESVGTVVNVTNPQSIGGLSLGNSVWGYVYLKTDGACECNTTAPAAAYAGNARSKAGDTSRRFLCAVKTDSSGNIIRFQYEAGSNLVLFREQTGTTFRVLAAGAATTKTTIACAVGVPPTSRVAFAKALNNATVASGIVAFFGSDEDAIDSTLHYMALGGTANGLVAFPLDASQEAAYLNNAVSGSTYFDIYGYYNTR